VTLKQLKYVVAPLVARIDANAAATALSKQASRIKAVDRGVDKLALIATFRTYKTYKQRRSARQKIERDLMSSLPPSFNGMDIDKPGDAEILKHWVEELDDFEESWKQFRGRLLEELADVGEDPGGTAGPSFDRPPSLAQCKRMIQEADWETSSDGGFDSLFTLKEALNNFENTYTSATEALASLTSKATFDSAASSLEKARDHLYDVTADPSSPFYDATEKVRIHEWRGDELTMPSQAAKTVRAPVTTAITITHFPNPFRDSLRSSQSHDLLNEVEAALARCAGQIENKIMGMMEATRPYISVEDLDVFILDWKTLARKHQVPTEQLR